MTVVAPPIQIRDADAGDELSLQALRNHYIAASCATFDEEAMTLQAVQAWMDRFAPIGPHRLLVASQNQRFLGFASSQPYREHPAFLQTVETSIYVAADASARGVGAALYSALFDRLRGQSLHRAVVGIALPNRASIALHRKFGFTDVGVFDEYAVKQGQRISSLWMQKRLG
jgi:phosphinothricin acetyltransferase